MTAFPEYITPVTVTGLEQFQRGVPNGAECDFCGRRVSWERHDEAMRRDRTHGWKFGGFHVDATAICPAHFS